VRAWVQVRQKCPQACQSQLECLTTAENPNAYFIWDRIQSLEPKHKNGTICLSRLDVYASIHKLKMYVLHACQICKCCTCMPYLAYMLNVYMICFQHEYSI